jgi:hypothetical protein
VVAGTGRLESLADLTWPASCSGIGRTKKRLWMISEIHGWTNTEYSCGPNVVICQSAGSFDIDLRL